MQLTTRDIQVIIEIMGRASMTGGEAEEVGPLITKLRGVINGDNEGTPEQSFDRAPSEQDS